MQNRERPSGTIEFGSADLAETELLVEGASSFVLLVDINRQIARERCRVIYQCSADALTMVPRIDEQSVDFGACHSEETSELIIAAESNPEEAGGQVCVTNLLRIEGDVVSGQEHMCRPYGIMPNVEQRGEV